MNQELREDAAGGAQPSEPEKAPDETRETPNETQADSSAESTFTAGQRATFDLRDSSGAIALRDGAAETIRLTSDGGAPFVLREGDHFRVRMTGGTIAVPAGIPVEAAVPPTVQLRVERTVQAGGETVVRPVAPETGSPETGAGQTDPVDLEAFAEEMSETAQRIFQRLTGAIRSSNIGVADDVARKLDEAAGRIDENARRVAQRIQQEVERVNQSGGRWQEAARRAAERAEARAAEVAARMERRAEVHGRRGEHHAERAARHAERHAERATRHAEREAERQVRGAAGRAGRGRWWFADRMNEWAGGPGRPGGPSAGAPPASVEERRAILAMLAEGKITSEQASKLLDALG